MTFTNSAIELDKISFSYPNSENLIIENLSLNLIKGDFIALTGESGSGYSTLLQILGTLLKPQKGDISILGNNIKTFDEKNLFDIRLNIGFLFQKGGLFEKFTVIQNILFPIESKLSRFFIKDKDKKKEFYNLAIDLLSEVGLKNSENLYPSQLSGGMRKRVALVRAYITNPKILLLDHPSAGLDPITSLDIFEFISKKNKENSLTTIVVSQEKKHIYNFCNKIYTIKDKNILSLK
ncbi:ATP-binding cassette domain-containing protein [bacterium]|nr:ATP-binding cassette domain-containing protein [bacterium]